MDRDAGGAHGPDVVGREGPDAAQIGAGVARRRGPGRAVVVEDRAAGAHGPDVIGAGYDSRRSRESSLCRRWAGIQIDLYDDGKSFDPDAVPTPSAQADALNEGGYGLHIVRQIMDSVQYQADTPKGNHWRLIKYIPSE